MKKTKTMLIILSILMISLIPTGFFIFSSVGTTRSPRIDPNDFYTGVHLESGLAGDVAMPEITEEFAADPLQMPSGAQTSGGLQTSGLSTSGAEVGDVVFDWYLSVATNDPYMTLRAKVGKCEVWVANDLFFDPGDPRNAYPDNITITDEMCEYLANEVNDVIYPTCSNYFGMSDDRDGTGTIFEFLGWEDYYWNWTDTEDPQTVMIKILNIRDEGYYDPTYPYFVIGFYSSTYAGYYNRNLIHLDAWQWWWRLGEDGTSWLPDLFVGDGHAFDYDSTTAHEYQHLIHRDYQEGPAAFMNEGCSMYSEFLCGYGISTSHVNSYMATPDNSLTVWSDQGGINILADYGVAALWTMYLSDHYGGADIIRNYVQSGLAGIPGVNAALAAFGHTEDFYDVYHDWRLANLIRSGSGKYNYKSIDMNDYDPIAVYTEDGLPVPWKMGTDYGNTITILGYDTGVSMLAPFASDYIEFTDWGRPGVISFNGVDELYHPMWIQEDMDDDGELEWYTSDPGGYADISLVTQVDLGGETSAELTFRTFYAIEEDLDGGWDFGFVQVSNDGGETWISLANEYTTEDHNPNAQASIVAELPGLTGYPEEIIEEMTFNLDDYLVDGLFIRFRYMTDQLFQDYGWWIEDVMVNGEPVPEFGPAWDEVDYMVTLVYEISTPWFTIYTTRDMMLDDMTEEGSLFAFSKYGVKIILVVSPLMEAGFTDYAFAAN